MKYGCLSFRLYRMLMLVLLITCTSLQAQTILNVKDFGALGDGIANDLPAFNQALKVARKSQSPITIRIPDGQYRLALDEDATVKSHLHIEGFSNMAIAGDKQAILIMGSPYHQGIGIFKSKNVTIKNLAIDYEKLPFTQGTIVAVSPEKQLIDIRVDKGYPLPTEAHIDGFAGKKNHNVGYIYDPKTKLKLNQYFDQYLRKQVQDLGHDIYRYKSSNKVENSMVGKKFAIVGRRKANAIKTDQATDCLIENVHVYSAPACGFNVASSGLVTINKCSIQHKPGTNRMLSTNADGLHSKWCTTGPTLSNSYFTGMGDDSVNIGGSYAPVIDQVDDYTVIIEAHGTFTNFPTDIVSLDLKTHGHINVGAVIKVKGTRVEGYKKPCLRITFENKLPQMVTWKNNGNDKHKCSQLLNLNACGRGGKVLNNHFYNHRVRGVLMRAPNGIIKGNHFDTLAGPGIIVSNDVGFLSEGPSGEGTLIEDNLFTKIERSNIWINSSVKNQDKNATQGVVGVKIINNRFENYGGVNAYGRGVVGNVLYIKNASDVLIENNTIGKPLTQGNEDAKLILKLNGDVTWKNNTVEGKALDLLKDAVH